MSWIQATHKEQIATLSSHYLQEKPFAHFVLDDFLNEEHIKTLAESLLNEQFHEKYADLFHFFQTYDLNNSENMQATVQFLKEEFIPFMQDISRLQLDANNLDIQGSIYADGNYLLCHDDRLEGRAIAFILYLTDLGEHEGGELKLYTSTGSTPTPDGCISVQPKANRLVCFTVSETSFHEVGEVLADVQRVALGGWLHHGRSQ